MVKIFSLKSSISLTFHPAYYIEIVIIVGRKSLLVSHLENYKLKKLNIKYAV